MRRPGLRVGGTWLKAAARHGCRLLTFAACAAVARAQEPDNTSARTLRGHVMHAEGGGLAPVRGAMVTLHRVGADRAGPIDSMRTAADGGYSFRYRPSGSADAVYLASVGYDGIVYFSTPTPASQGVPDGDITDFDTTSGPVPIRVAGHHVVVSAPRDGQRREIEEVFELSNDSSVTRVASGDTLPVWSAHAPTDAVGVRGVQTSDIDPAAISVRDRRVELYAPVSPGMRQLAYGYAVDARTFPLALPLATPTEVLEVLVEEPAGRAEGAGLVELEPVTKGGRTFHRFLAQDVPAHSVVRIVVPAPVSHETSRVARLIVLALATVMLLALAWSVSRRASRAPAANAGRVTPAPRAAEALLHEIAALDVARETAPAPLPDERARYERHRARLKAELARALATTGEPR